MTYAQFLTDLNARGMFRIRPSLDRVKKVLRVLGNPQDQWPSIHIAGTNGKGSVAAVLESALRACGYRTGLYTSPHLIDLRERVQINGNPLNHVFLAAAEEVFLAEKQAKAPLTYFEALTAIAFCAFAKKKVDVGIIECGLGGLWDATNVIRQPTVSVITSVGLDHTEWLGRGPRQIAQQKAGIIKPHGYVVSGVRGEALRVISQTAREQKAELCQIDRHFTAETLTASTRSGKQNIRVAFRGEPPQIVPLGLLGSYQTDNAAMAMAVLRKLKQSGWRISSIQRDRGLRDVVWPGRFQIIYQRKLAPILLDGAHNPPAMATLLKAIESSEFKNVPKTFVFSAFKDKDFRTMARMISRVGVEICVCSLPGPRGAGIAQLRTAFSRVPGPVRICKTPKEALTNALQDTPRDGLVVVTGSFALVGAILSGLAAAGNGPVFQKEKTHA